MRLNKSLVLVVFAVIATPNGLKAACDSREMDAAAFRSCLLAAPRTDEILPFSTDGCSLVPPFLEKPAWRACCIQHDIAYWRGGQREERLQADLALKHCFAQAGDPYWGAVFYRAVRLAGGPDSAAYYRWAYGWPFYMGYDALNTAQQRSASEALDAYQREQQLER